MCGLVGVAGDLFHADTKVFADLLICNQLRGAHSTGVAAIARRDKDGARDSTVLKTVGTPDLVVGSLSWNTSVTPMAAVLIGHGRHATVGAISDDNAHPFEFSNLIGAHNGTLNGRSASELDHFDKFGTDSEALYHNINEHGIEEVIPKIQGVWALTWFDFDRDVLCFLRNSERPLSYTFSKDARRLYWASEAWMLRGVLARNRIDHTDVVSLKENTLVRFSVPNSSTERFGDYEAVPLEGYKAPAFFRNRYQGYPQYEMGWSSEDDENDRAAKRVIQGWAGASSQEKTESDSKPKSKSDDALSASVVKPGFEASNPPSDPKSANDARELGFNAGLNRRPASANPYCPNTRTYLHEEWESARKKGLEKCVPAASSPEEIRRISGYMGEMLSEREFRARTNGLCHWGKHIVNHSFGHYWIAKNKFICSSCIGGNKFRNEVLNRQKKEDEKNVEVAA